MPSSFNLQSSKKTLIIKFVSNGSVRKTGFRATLFGKYENKRELDWESIRSSPRDGGNQV